jgi:PAS domain S-box-containing protein
LELEQIQFIVSLSGNRFICPNEHRKIALHRAGEVSGSIALSARTAWKTVRLNIHALPLCRRLRFGGSESASQDRAAMYESATKPRDESNVGDSGFDNGHGGLNGAERPLAGAVGERGSFEALLAELSATFVNLPAHQVDSHIQSALQRLVEFLEVERGGLAEVLADPRQLVITHSYNKPGVPPLPQFTLPEQMPWYANTVRSGKVFRVCRLPEELPSEATHERAYFSQIGVKSHVMIPLKVMGAVVGAIGFSSFREYREWPDGVVQRLQLVGEIFTNALARKRADIALRESEERFRLMADAAPVMVWMSGPDKLCTYLNKHWLEFTGLPLEKQIGEGWSRSVHPEDLAHCLQTYFDAFDARREFRMEYRLERFDGAYRWILDTGAPRFAPDGTFVGYVGSCIDISDLKQAENTLRARERSLKQTRERLRRLTAKLINAQEEERRHIAREMHDDWTQRLALLGIDISKVEKRLNAPDEARFLLRRMQEDLVKLSEDVHALSRHLHPSILDDLGLVEALRSECAAVSRRERIAINYRPEQISDELPKDVALCIYRVAQEALRNIAKHAAVKQSWVLLSDTSKEIVLRVWDTGAGFDPKGAPQHPGIGLSSMAERVRLVQGELTVRSAPGEGTSVEVRIPLVRSKP